jgi:hypothetical protein
VANDTNTDAAPYTSDGAIEKLVPKLDELVSTIAGVSVLSVQNGEKTTATVPDSVTINSDVFCYAYFVRGLAHMYLRRDADAVDDCTNAIRLVKYRIKQMLQQGKEVRSVQSFS